MITVNQARFRTSNYYGRHFSVWAAHEFITLIGCSSESDGFYEDKCCFSLPLHPPTEQRALIDLEAARLWVQSWREFGRKGIGEILWSVRKWTSIGHQEVPERLILSDPQAIAAFALKLHEWQCTLARTTELRSFARTDGCRFTPRAIS